MNRLLQLVVLGLLVVAVLLCLEFHRHRVSRLNGRIGEHVADAERLLAVRYSETRELKLRVQADRDLRDQARRELNAAAATARPPTRPVQPDTEGLFPPGRPYFHVPKAMLDRFIVDLFDAGQLHPAMTVLLGLDAREESELRMAYAALRADLETEETRLFQPIRPPQPVAGRSNLVVIGKLPALEDNGISLRDAFYQKASEILGRDRAPLFLRRAEAAFDSDLHGLGSIAREFRVLDPDGPRPLLLVEYERNGEHWTDKTAWPIPEAWSAPAFAHLFPSETPVMASPSPIPPTP